MKYRRPGASGLNDMQPRIGAMSLDGCTAAVKRAAVCANLILAFGIPGHAAEEPSATPYRPTVSNPADLPLPGWLEFEVGGLRAKGGELARRDSFPYLFKLAFTPDWGLLLGGEAHVAQIDFDGNRLGGAGDTQLFLKRRFAVNDESAFGVEAGLKVPTAKGGIGSEKRDYILNGIYSRELGPYHLDLNVSVTRLGAIGENEGRVLRGWAAGLSRELNDRWTFGAEVSGTTRHGVSDTAQFLVAASYGYSKRVVFDAGAAFGLNRASPDWALFAGVTVLLGRLW